MVLAHTDPGVPIWLDPAGRRLGMIFWHFQLPEAEFEPLRTELVSLGAENHA